MPGKENRVIMACPHCGAELAGRPEQFADLCQCPACGQSGYFVKTVSAAAAPAPALPAAVQAFPVAAPAPAWARPLAWTFGGLCGGILLAVAALVTRGGEKAGGGELSPETRARLAAAVAEADTGRRLRRLQSLSAETAGNPEVERALVAAMLENNRERESQLAKDARAAAAAAAELREREELARVAAAEMRRREDEVARRERQLEQLANREAAVAAAERRLREQEESLRRDQDDLRRRMESLEKDLAARKAEAPAPTPGGDLWARVSEEDARAKREAALTVAAQQALARQTAAATPPAPVYVFTESPAPRSSVVYHETVTCPVYWGLPYYPRPPRPPHPPRPPRPPFPPRPCPGPVRPGGGGGGWHISGGIGGGVGGIRFHAGGVSRGGGMRTGGGGMHIGGGRH